MTVTSGKQRVVDGSVHVFFQGNQEIRDWLSEPFKSRAIPDVEGGWYQTPDGEYAPETVEATDGYPGSDPRQVGPHLFEERGVDVAILLPLTRGIIPDRHVGSAICAAHNQMLAERWLDDEVYGERFRGTIRVNPEDIEGALKEIDRSSGHPRMVQIGIPLQSREPYGKPQFWPLWEEAERRSLPVAVHVEPGANHVAFAPTPSGHPRTYPQYATFMPLNYLYHLFNMIAEGVFERFQDLKFVWADGGAEMLTPFMWRFDTFGRPHLEQTPWAPNIPSSYLPDHVYFVQNHDDGPGQEGIGAEWAEMTGKSDMIMFGSSYPHWSMTDVDSISSDLTDEQRQKVLWQNADKLYGLGLGAAVPA